MFVSVVDVVIIAVIGIFTLRCSIRGFAIEFLSMAAVVFGLVVAILYYREMAPAVTQRIMPELHRFSAAIAFVILFFVVFIVVSILKKLVIDFVRKIKFHGVDRFLGFFFGIAEGIVFVYLLLFLVSVQTFIEPDIILGKSILAQKLMGLFPVDIKQVVESVVLSGKPLMEMNTVV